MSTPIVNRARILERTENLLRRDDGASGSEGGMDRYGSRTLLSAGAVVLLSCLLGIVLAAAQAPQHTAELEILHDYGDMDAAASERRQETQLALARSRSVLEPVADEYGLDVDVLADRLEVELVGSSEVLRLRVTDPDPDQAIQLVSAVGQTYLDIAAQSEVEDTEPESEAAQELITERIAALDERRAEIQDALTELEEERRIQSAAEDERIPPTGEEQRLQTELQEVLRRIGELESVRFQRELDASETDREPAQVLTEAYLLAEPAGPTPLRGGLLGFGIGLILATAIVVVRSSLRRPAGPVPGGGSAAA